jgi:hypothetical protein
MHLPHVRWQWLIFAIAVCVIRPVAVDAADDQVLTRKQIKQFLLNAEVVSSRPDPRGVTHPWRLTLSNGVVTHDASFQTADRNNKDYRYNLAASVLADMLGLEDTLPVYVEREWRGRWDAFSWWLPVQMDEAERLKRKVEPPDLEAWNKQMDNIRVFDALVNESDTNPKDLLIGNDWKIYRVDYSRGFLLDKNIQNPKSLVRCDRNLWEGLKNLNGHQLEKKTKGYLIRSEVQALMARRDKILAYFRGLIAEKGENTVLFSFPRADAESRSLFFPIPAVVLMPEMLEPFLGLMN